MRLLKLFQPKINKNKISYQIIWFKELKKKFKLKMKMKKDEKVCKTV